MTRYLPTLRGWIAFVLAAFSIFYFPVLCPALFVESGVGTFVMERVTPTVWGAGAVLILVCLLASVEAFRRGSRAEKWFAGISLLLTIGLAVQYFQLATLSVHKSPNQSPEPTWLGASVLRLSVGIRHVTVTNAAGLVRGQNISNARGVPATPKTKKQRKHKLKPVLGLTPNVVQKVEPGHECSFL